jgi:DNA-binding response OmpR family regulator
MPSLEGRAILVVEDEPLVAQDIHRTFQDAGARVIPARTRTQALQAVSSREVSAAVLDLVLGDHREDLRRELTDRGIPNVISTGMPKQPDERNVFIEKPAGSHRLVAAIEDVLKTAPGVA